MKETTADAVLSAVRERLTYMDRVLLGVTGLVTDSTRFGEEVG